MLSPKLTIFLDIDGVLNRYPDRDNLGIYLEEYERYTDIFEKRYKLDWMFPPCIYAFRTYVEKLRLSGIEVNCILSSAWRIIYSIEKMNRVFEDRGFGKNFIIDRTPSGMTRGEEISHSIEEHSIKNYIIIDDEPCHIYQKDNLYQTGMQTGFTEEDIDKIYNLSMNIIK